MRRILLVLVASLSVLTPASAAPAADGSELLKPNAQPRRPRNQPLDPRQAAFRTDVPAHPFDIILGRPTRDSITISILTYSDVEGQLIFGTTAGDYPSHTPINPLKRGEPNHLHLAPLTANTQYFYRFRYRPSNSTDFQQSDEFTFRTARPPGSPFTFTVQADSHLDFNTIPQTYAKTLAIALAEKPDFHFELGDTFMTDKYPRYKDAAAQYLAQRYYFGLLCHSAPLFFVIGNHDGEAGWLLNGGADNMAIWSNQMRRRYLPNPFPDNFYTGNSTPDPIAGRLENYYAFQWGDAQFIILDPFWYTTRKSRSETDNWNRTLGRAQYDWLKQSLESSKSKFKFIFLHHLVGGLDKEGRGGAEAAKLFEWGGQSLDGQSQFAKERPGWPAPIHGLLIQNHVTAVFHGHDHLYARQQLDGINYFEVPQPGSRNSGNAARSATEYGYTHGTILAGPGHLRIKVTPESATLEYVPTRNGPVEQETVPNAADSIAIKAISN